MLLKACEHDRRVNLTLLRRAMGHRDHGRSQTSTMHGDRKGHLIQPECESGAQWVVEQPLLPVQDTSAHWFRHSYDSKSYILVIRQLAAGEQAKLLEIIDQVEYWSLSPTPVMKVTTRTSVPTLILPNTSRPRASTSRKARSSWPY
jgi:hypothetical protein